MYENVAHPTLLIPQCMGMCLSLTQCGILAYIGA